MRTPPKPPPKGQKTISSFFTLNAAASSSSAPLSTSKANKATPTSAVVVVDDEDPEDAPRALATKRKAPSDDECEKECASPETKPLVDVDVNAVLAAIPESKPETHAKFLHKLSLDRRRRDLEPEAGEKESGTTSTTSLQKMTPLEESVKKFKAKYKGTLLMIEVGYKFHFYGDDARDASKCLGIFAYQSRNYLVASVPAVRLHVYVRRLVQAGYRVGVIKQTETAALKASGESESGNKSGLFERKLVGLYTKATLDAGASLADAADTGEKASAEMSSGKLSNYLLCVAEEQSSLTTTRVGLVAVETSTGDVFHGEFTDTMQRAELESRLLCISPAEIVLVTPISEQTERLIKAMYGSGANSARIEYLNRESFADVTLSGAAATEMTSLVHTALCAGTKYLRDFGQADILSLDSAFRPLEGRDEMKLSPNVLRQLEVLTSSSGTYKGSLLWLMSHTTTPMGGRLLRHWVTHPLQSRKQIEARLDAVSELQTLTSFEEGSTMDHNKSSTSTTSFNGLKMQLKNLPDIERYLARIFHGTATPAEFVGALTSLVKFSEACADMRQGQGVEIKSKLLEDNIEAVTDSLLRALSDELLSALNLGIALSDRPSKTKIGLFKDDPERFPELFAATEAVEAAKKGMDDLLPALRKKLNLPKLCYTSVGGVGGGEWLIEVPTDKSCPSTWIKVSSNKSKKVIRYHPPEVTAAAAALEREQERHMIAADAAWKEFLSTFRENYLTFKTATTAIATIDALHALAVLSRNDGYVRPTFVDDSMPPVLQIVDGRHPVLDAHLLESFVPNGINLDSQRTRALVITGPNMGGKSCYIRQIALLCIMAQIGSFVPAKSARLSVLDAVYTRMGASDNLAMGSSTFLEEMSEASAVLETCTPRSLVIMDELGRGTSTHDGVAIAAATLEHLVRNAACFTLFVTHYPSVARDVQANYPSHCSSSFTSYVELPGSSEEVPRIQFLYKLTPGVAHRSFGLNVARMACLPNKVIQTAGVKASELEVQTARRTLIHHKVDESSADSTTAKAKSVLSAIASGDVHAVRSAQKH